MCLNALAERWAFKFERQRARADVAYGVFRSQRVVLAKPQTFMNNSGESVRGLTRMYDVDPPNLLVIYDDLDLPFGRLRLRDRGSSGGHRGIQSIIDSLSTNQFPRLRIGLGRPPAGAEPIDYVLRSFSQAELTELKAILERIAEGVELFLTDGVVAAMNVLNVLPRSPRVTEEPPPASR
jgi:PTH1 family peptidyl-tRNA hydrolase